MNVEQPQMLQHKDVIEALLRYKGITSGCWGLAIQFGFGVGNATTDPSASASPTAFIGILGIGLAPANESTAGTVVDASTLRSGASPAAVKKRTAKKATK